MTVTCQNTECAERGSAKVVEVALRDGEPVLCGECGQPCKLTG